VGTASWYGEYFEGKPTASGEPYNMYDLTAAHLSLPLGTFVKITNLENRRTVVVRINDRGPVVPDRIIDVSYAAARVLQFDEQGIQRVRLDVVRPPRPATAMAMLRQPTLGQ
jgi:rare lipoprotein A